MAGAAAQVSEETYWREHAPKDRQSLDILPVKKEAKLSASEVSDVEVGRGDADLQQSNLFVVCH